MKWYQKLHWQIIISLILGLIYGIIATQMQWVEFTLNWVSPFGTIFINLLKLIAVPLVLTSLICGVASLNDTKKLSKLGGKTIGIYIATTFIAVTTGLILVNLLQPGSNLPTEFKNKLQQSYQKEIVHKQGLAAQTKQRRPLQPLVDMVPSNFFSSASNNRNMLQVVFIAILFGIALVKLPSTTAAPIITLFQSLNEMVITVVEIIMKTAPIGVFGLMANTIIKIAGNQPGQLTELLSALGFYMVVVILGLLIHTTVFLPTLIKFFTPFKLTDFFKSIIPAQLLAFSTSSSGATLPVTIECCEKELKLDEDVCSFVLPLGATINMDGTALYQAVAAVFIAQATGIALDLGAQLTIILTAVLASIGTAAVPGAGIIMLIIILESIGVPSAGIALILGVDRLLDMMRTVTNVTGDATVASIIHSNR
jgi:Na+/H+-dicarboxylate symporter